MPSAILWWDFGLVPYVTIHYWKKRFQVTNKTLDTRVHIWIHSNLFWFNSCMIGHLAIPSTLMPLLEGSLQIRLKSVSLSLMRLQVFLVKIENLSQIVYHLQILVFHSKTARNDTHLKEIFSHLFYVKYVTPMMKTSNIVVGENPSHTRIKG